MKARKCILKKRGQENKKRIYSIIKSKCDKDQVFKLKLRIRNLICQCFRRKSYKKGSKTENILGCSFDNLKAHIESQFKSGMSWNNWGQWHIDHIMPVSMAKTEDEIIRLNHHRNLRPLWAHENLSKSDKTPETLVLFWDNKKTRKEFLPIWFLSLSETGFKSILHFLERVR